MPEDLNEEQRNRLWEHGMHVENSFFNELNFFLIFESVLLGGTINVLLSNNRSTGKLILMGIIGFGLLLTLVWTYTQFSQGYIFMKLKNRLKEVLPEYNETVRQRGERKGWPGFDLQALGLIIPSLVALVWLALLSYLWLVY